uniref:BTB domain-containing protein n=1 Tax=Panagrellus redivivus TaxID=6233 RepID=A0A7E4W7D7_PANRE
MPSVVRLIEQAAQFDVPELILSQNIGGRFPVTPIDLAERPFTWTLEIAPNGYDNTDIGYFTVILNFDKNHGSFRVYCEVFTPDYAVITRYCNHNNCHHAVINPVIILRVSHEEVRNSGCIHDGLFVIRCTVYLEIPCAEIPAPVLPLFDDTIQVALIVGDETIEIAKNILTYVSPFFRAILANDTNDGGKIRIVIDNEFNSLAVLRFLQQVWVNTLLWIITLARLWNMRG